MFSILPRSANLAPSLPSSKLPSSNNSQTTGKTDGSPRTQRRMSRLMTRSGHTLAPGRWRSPPSSKAWRVTRALLSRTRLLITPFPPNFPRPLTTRTTPLLYNMKSSFRVSGLVEGGIWRHSNSSTDGLECGGAYMKLLQDNKALHAEEFSNSSPYMIMFGPDKCGATNKV